MEISGKLCELHTIHPCSVRAAALNWLGGSRENARLVVIKRALPHLWDVGRRVLEVVRGQTCIRQMIDIIESSPSLVLE